MFWIQSKALQKLLQKLPGLSSYDEDHLYVLNKRILQTAIAERLCRQLATKERHRVSLQRTFMAVHLPKAITGERAT